MGKKKIRLWEKRKILIQNPITDYSVFLCQTKEFYRRNTIMFPQQIKQEDKINPFDFRFLKPIGMGTFGLVYLTQLKQNSSLYAVKVIRKDTVEKCNATPFIIRHRKILQGINFPFCQGILCSFQDSGFLFTCQTLMTGGDLFWHLCKQKKFYEPVVLFYAAQMVLAIEYLQFIGIVHRNIKPENILVDNRGYLKLTGFSFAKKIRNSLTYTMCGTADYLAPEQILQIGHTLSVDWWSLGVLIYELVAGFTPFEEDDLLDTYKNVLKGRFTLGASFSFGLRELLVGLLKVKTIERLGIGGLGVQEIKDARWFQNLDWIKLVNQTLLSPFVPSDKSIDSNFPKMKPVKIIPPTEDASIEMFKGF